MTKTFRDLEVAPELCDALEAQGITYPFPIQELTLPLALAGNDLIGQARTGTGKTLAFGLPLLQRIDRTRAVTQALIVVPTRELCIQVYSDLQIGSALGVTSVSVYGGVPYEEQIDALEGGAHVVVGTPGRLLDHLNRGTLQLGAVTELVLDEADEMLDMGFLPDVERLIESCNGDGRHTMLFSATMPTAIVKLARRYMHQPTFTRAEQQVSDTAPTVEQHFFQVHRMDKPRVLARILQAPERKGVFVFVRTKHMADRLVTELEDLNTPAIAIHGDLRQTTRERNLDRFRSGKATVLVATEVAARGLDVSDVTHVVNYDCPDDDKMYLHRIGRTARAGQTGVAVTFAEFNEAERLNVIRKAVGATDDVVEVFSTSDELTRRFALPEQTPWGHLATQRSSGGGRGRSGGSRSPRPSDDTRRSPRASGGRRTNGEKDTSTGTAASVSNGARDDRPAKTDGRTKAGSRAKVDSRAKAGNRAKTDTTAERDTRARTTGRPKAGSRATADTTADRDPGARRQSIDTASADATSDETTSRDTTPSDTASRSRTRTRTRTRTQQSAGEPTPATSRANGEEHTGDERAPRTRARARARRGGTARASGSADRSPADSDRASDRRDRDRTRETSAAGPDDREGGGASDNDGRGQRSGGQRDRQRAGGQRDAERSRSQRGGNQRRSGQSSRQQDRNGDGDEARADATVTARGRPARGEGEPQSARRIKVEHLP